MPSQPPVGGKSHLTAQQFRLVRFGFLIPASHRVMCLRLLRSEVVVQRPSSTEGFRLGKLGRPCVLNCFATFLPKFHSSIYLQSS
jgi:hypothetical protein